MNGKAISSSGNKGNNNISSHLVKFVEIPENSFDLKDLNKTQAIAEFGSDRDPAKVEMKIQSMRNLIGKVHM